ncbi:MAG: hypothetical protein ACXVEF_39265 [Polyangiales bacterium]
MASVMAIISKAEFDKFAGGTARDHGGVCYALDRYVSSHKALETLREGGSLFLVTVRPPNDKLLLVAILEKPKHDGTAWVSAKKNAITSIPIGSVKGRLKFDTGKGIDAKPGALGMSLQTPRRLTDDDVRLLREAAAGEAAEPSKATKKPAAKEPKKKKTGKIPEELSGLMQSAFIEIENEYLDDIRDDPDAVLAAADFSMTIQSIFSGSFDAPKDTLPLLEVLAPFADGKVITHRLAPEIKKGADATQLLNELVDAYAISAINVFGTAILALALDRPKDVPAVALPFREHLTPHAAALKELLAED